MSLGIDSCRIFYHVEKGEDLRYAIDEIFITKREFYEKYLDF